MYFYNSLLLTINILILTIHIQSQKIKGPGTSGCSYLVSATDECGGPKVKITDIPKECTSLLYDSLTVNLKYEIYNEYCSCEKNAKSLGQLDDMLESKKPIYVYFGHNTQAEWTQVLACEDSNDGVNSLDEMESLKIFMEEHPGITGLILINLQNNCAYSKEFPEYSKNLKKYIDVMKKCFPELEIGIEFLGAPLIDQFISSELPWLDIKVIDPSLDFYIISLKCLNDCVDDFIDIGDNPMDTAISNYSMVRVKSVLTQAGIPKEKTYFSFRLNANSDPNDSNYYCNLTIQEICLDKNKTRDWCFDDQASFNKKGQFAKENGVGFVTTNIILNDPTNLCQCEKPFASFYALLDGFNGNTSKKCELFSEAC